MKKFLFFIFFLINVFTCTVQAQELAQDTSDVDFADISDEFVINDASGDNPNSFETYLFRLFKLYRHFEQKFPNEEIDKDLKPEIQRILPNLTEQEVYDKEDNIRFVIKNYRGLKSLVAKIKEEIIAPPLEPIDVSLDELKLYDEPYIESPNELVIIYAPMKVVPYATDKKNFLATEAAYKKSKIQSPTAKKIDELKNQLRALEFSKIPFYNIIYADPFTGSIGIGDWDTGTNVQARLLHSQTATGNNTFLKAGLNISIAKGYFIPDNGNKTIDIEIADSKNVKQFNLLRPLPVRINHTQNIRSQSGYINTLTFPLSIELDTTSQPVLLAPKISFALCNKDFDCQNISLSPKLDISAGVAQYTAMYNLIEQNFNTLPTASSPDLQLKKASVYTNTAQEEYFLLQFETDASQTNFEFHISSPQGIEFLPPILSIGDNNIYVSVYPLDKTQKISGKEFEFTAKLNNYNIIRQRITPSQASIFDADKPTLSLGLIGLAILGGLLLNLMPCVFPVLGLKVISLTKFGASAKKQVKTAFFYILLGIMSAFILLIAILSLLKYSGFVLGWGIQFQSIEFLLFISFAVLMFLLVSSGRINFPSPQWVEKFLQSQSSRNNALNYFTGLLLVLLSTPCSAPYLGTALGFALSSSSSDMIIILSSVGMGLALPYCILFIKPEWARYCPHPGRWSTYLQYAMNTMLILTLFWLLSIIATQVGLGGALRIGLYLLLFAGVWSFVPVVIREMNKSKETVATRHAVTKIMNYVATIISFILVIISLIDIKISANQSQNEPTHLPITTEQQTQIRNYLQENKAVLIAVGADWCLTCKVNDFVAINNFKIQNLVKENKLILLHSNQTRYSAETLTFMEKYGRKALPFYLLYTPKFQNGIVLPELLSDTNLYHIITNGLN